MSLENPGDPGVFDAERVVINVARTLYTVRANKNRILDSMMPKLWYAVECLMDAKGVPREAPPLEHTTAPPASLREALEDIRKTCPLWIVSFQDGWARACDAMEASLASNEPLPK